MSIADKFGISTIVLSGQTMLEAIESVADAGFKWFELFSSPPNKGLVDWPMRPQPTCWPRYMNRHERKELSRALNRSFDGCTVHVQIAFSRMDHPNPGLREESRRQYYEYLELAHDLGASLCTIHAAGDNVTFGRDFADRAKEYGIQSGYETGSMQNMHAIISRINRPNFGLVYDVAHAHGMDSWTKETDPVETLDLFRGKIVEVHVHGVWRESSYVRDHQNWNNNNFVDYNLVMAKLKTINYDGPFIFEISEKNTPTVIESCLEFRDKLVELWENV